MLSYGTAAGTRRVELTLPLTGRHALAAYRRSQRLRNRSGHCSPGENISNRVSIRRSPLVPFSADLGFGLVRSKPPCAAAVAKL
ncbi:hypothetical protein EVAR_22881_1 [Eumeta japonica]|uniref:Uncharacterized protein n=1 Tax=Eumeta variegata TaxID=151549 RepID=A0A4C1UU36_EUMVA|nr:hypothetical protein EVAR_22881_1 [Eumeta japonica]